LKTIKVPKEASLAEYPFARELITDVRGKVSKIVLDVPAYWRLLDAVEDAGLYRAMLRTKNEKALTREQALTVPY